MNKQVVIAGILGAAAAQTPCDGPFVAAAQEAKAELEAKKAALEAKTAGLVAAAAAVQTDFDTAQGRVTAQATLMAPFLTALSNASTEYQTQFDAKAAATAAETALATPVAAAATALTTAQSAVTTQQGKINDQAATIVKLQAAVDEHTTEKASMQTALTTATTAETNAITALTAATTAKNALVTEKETVSTGQDALLTAATSDEGTKQGLYNTAVSEEQTVYAVYKPAKLAFDKKTKELGYIVAGCTFNDGTAYTCIGQTNSPILAFKTAADTALSGLTTTKDTQEGLWNTKVTAVATAWDVYAQATAAKGVATDNVTTISSAITTATSAETVATGAKTTATAGKTTAQTNYNAVDGQLTQATTDLARGAAVQSTLEAALVPLSNDVVVKTYLKGVQDDLLAVQVAAKATADTRLAEFLNIKSMAEETVTRAQSTATFYEDLDTVVTAAKTAADKMVTDNATAITNAQTNIDGAVAELAAFVSACKEAGYEEAQAAMKALIDKNAAEEAAAATVKADYDAKSAFSTSGETNTLCAYPAKAKDAAQEPRPVCKDGYCCGAAQKFLKDGTKLAIETCQKATGVHTYQYYPPLPASAAVEPTPETWRFQCISGAQKLVATATAALAASYMMA